MTARVLMTIGALTALAGVALGAFGAHAMRSRLSAEMLTVWETAVQYHLVHALGLVLIGLAALHIPGAAIRWAGWLMLAGAVLFSGSLYLLAGTGTRWLGAVTPVGGVLLLAAWAVAAFAFWRGLG